MAEEKVKKPKSLPRKIIEWILTGLLVVLFVFIAFGTADGMMHKKDHYGQTIRFGFGSFIVQTDSMEPDYKVGSALITYAEAPESIEKRFKDYETTPIDITFMDVLSSSELSVLPYNNAKYFVRTAPTGVPMTHRLREIHVNESVEVGKGRYTYVVAGINVEGHKSGEGQYQAFTEKEILGVVKTNSKVLGGIFQFMTSVWGLLVLLLIPALYLIVTTVIDMTKDLKEADEEELTTADGTKFSVPNPDNRVDGLSKKEKDRLKEQLLKEMMEAKSKGK